MNISMPIIDFSKLIYPNLTVSPPKQIKKMKRKKQEPAPIRVMNIGTIRDER
jgi:hypothetical protein